MAISTYSELKTAVADFLNRDDLTDVIPTFISLTEAKLGRRYKDFTALSGNNPSNWILSSHPDVYLYGALVEASPYLSDDARVAVWGQLYATAVLTLKGTVNNADFDDYSGLILAIGDWMGRADLDGAIPQLIKLAEAKLFRKFDGVSALSYAANTNWILQNHPDLYLYGSLSEASPYIGNDERIQVWKTLYEAEIGRIRKPKSGVNLDNYNGLKSAIADWLERYDLDDAIPDFIQLAEARIKRRVRDITALSDGNTTNWVLTNHPDVYLFGALSESAPYLGQDERAGLWQAKYDAAFSEVRRPDSDSGLADYNGLKFAIADWLNRPDIDDSIPDFIALAEARIKRRIRDIDSLSVSNTTNWVLTNHPDVYLFGALAEASPYLGNDERSVLWQSKYQAAFAEVRRPDADSGLSDYDGLQAVIADWLNRPDIDGIIPELINLAESKIMRDLRHWRQQRRVTTTLNESFENLPSDFLQPINFYIDTNQGEKTLEFSSLGEINRRKRFAAGVSGEPVVYTINSGQIEFMPAPDDDYPLTLIYYAKTPNLSAEQDSNWLLTYYPDIYLYGSLMQASSYLNNDERVAVWAQLYNEALAKANQESDAATYSGPLVLRNK